MKPYGVQLTPLDRACLVIMLAPAQTKGWRGDNLKDWQCFAEVIRLFPPGSSTPAHLIARIDVSTVALMDGSEGSLVGHFPTLMAAFTAVSKLLDEQALA